MTLFPAATIGGNVPWAPGIVSSLNSGYGFSPPATSAALTAFTSGYTASGGNVSASLAASGTNAPGTAAGSAASASSSVINAGSIDELVARIVEMNSANIASGAEQSAQLALQTAQTLDPAMAARFQENLATALPGYQDLVAQMSENTAAFLQGVIPEDAADLIRMYSAEQGMQGALASTARNLGLTSLDLMTQGHQQGMDLISLASTFLTPPTVDIAGTAADFRNQFFSANTLTPAQGLQAALEKRSQDMENRWKQQDYSLNRERLQLSADQFAANMAWDRELSAMNQSYEKWRFNTQMSMFNKTTAARREEQRVKLNAYQGAASTIRGPSRSTVDTKPAPGTETVPAKQSKTIDVESFTTPEFVFQQPGISDFVQDALTFIINQGNSFR